MQYYRHIRKSQVALNTDNLRPEMEKLQNYIKRLGENWNDAVAQGVQTVHINNIVQLCNSINSVLIGLSSQLETDLSRIDELEKICLSTATTGSIK